MPPVAISPFPRGSALLLMDFCPSGACGPEQRLIYGACCGHVALVAQKQAWVHLDSLGFAALGDLTAVPRSAADPLCDVGEVPYFLMHYRYSKSAFQYSSSPLCIHTPRRTVTRS